MQYSWRAGGSGWLRAVRSRAGRVNKVVAASTALVVAAALTGVAGIVTSPPQPTPAGQHMYQHADGSRTAMFYQASVNYRLPDGSWARIDTSLMPAGGPGAGAPSPSSSPSPSASQLFPSPSSPPSLISPSMSLVTPT